MLRISHSDSDVAEFDSIELSVMTSYPAVVADVRSSYLYLMYLSSTSVLYMRLTMRIREIKLNIFQNFFFFRELVYSLLLQEGAALLQLVDNELAVWTCLHGRNDNQLGRNILIMHEFEVCRECFVFSLGS